MNTSNKPPVLAREHPRRDLPGDEGDSSHKDPRALLATRPTTNERGSASALCRPRPLKQIRQNCLECCGNQYSQVRFCPITDCPLWYLRFGIMPRTMIKREGPEARGLFDPESFKAGGKFSISEDVGEP